MSTSYRPQTNGKTEVVNRCLKAYLRCTCRERPKEWSNWLPLAEWWYNSNWHTAIGITPYEVVYGQPPYHPFMFHVAGDSLMEAVDRSIKAREELLKCSSTISTGLSRE